jgi:hypothetical protein
MEIEIKWDEQVFAIQEFDKCLFIQWREVDYMTPCE